MRLRSLMIGGKQIEQLDKMIAVFEPSLPYIYLPPSYFDKVVDRLEAAISEQLKAFGIEINQPVCIKGKEKSDPGYCRIPQTCKLVDRLVNLTASFEIYSEANGKSSEAKIRIELENQDLLVDGSWLGEEKDSQFCYLTLFTHKHPGYDSRTIIIGSTILRKYSLVFDAESDPVKIGIGLKK